jgi:membrane-associated phospholipid phosphatase
VRGAIVAALLASWLGGAGAARADERAPAPSLPAAVAPAAPPALAWHQDWPRFRWWEYAGTAAAGATSWYLRMYRPPPSQPKWQGGNWFDDTLRSWLRAETPGGRHDSQYASDRLADLGYAVPFGIDLTVALFAHGQLETTWQMMMMDLEAFAVSGLINNFLFYEVGRGRPSAADCAKNPNYDELCFIGANASLPSGHTQTVATGAGLTCVHHRYLPLYGNRWADASACGFMVAATIASAATRIMADRHYATDNLIGIAVGFGAGYGLPWLLHYRQGTTSLPGAGSDAPQAVTLMPLAGRASGGLALVGAF